MKPRKSSIDISSKIFIPITVFTEYNRKKMKIKTAAARTIFSIMTPRILIDLVRVVIIILLFILPG